MKFNLEISAMAFYLTRPILTLSRRWFASSSVVEGVKAKTRNISASVSPAGSSPDSKPATPQVKLLLKEVTDLQDQIEHFRAAHQGVAADLQKTRADLDAALSAASSLKSEALNVRAESLNLESNPANLPENAPNLDTTSSASLLQEELDGWKETASQYERMSREFESKLRDTQIEQRRAELSFEEELHSARQTAALPLLLAMGGAAVLTWVGCHAKKLVDFRHAAVAASERERESMDQQAEISRKLNNAVAEVKRLQEEVKVVKAAKSGWLW